MLEKINREIIGFYLRHEMKIFRLVSGFCLGFMWMWIYYECNK